MPIDDQLLTERTRLLDTLRALVSARTRLLDTLKAWHRKKERREAAAAAELAVASARVLFKRRPRNGLPGLARGLTELGAARRALRQREGALAVVREAVVHYRTLLRRW